MAKRTETKPAAKGHNSGGASAEQLKSYEARYNTLLDQRGDVNDSMRDLMAEVEAAGFDKKVFRAVLKERQRSEEDRANYYALFETYAKALGFSILE